jgi:hypothetical protein
LFNGFLTARFGGVRPYKTQVNVAAPRNGTGYQDATEAFNAVPFHNPKTFQIISPGLDGIYGSIISTDPNDPDAPPVHFVTETGTPITPVSGASGLAGLVFTPGNIGPRFQDVDWLSGITVNGHLDNITNFSTAALGDDLQ